MRLFSAGTRRRMMIYSIVCTISAMMFMPVNVAAEDDGPLPPWDTRSRSKVLLRVWIPHISINRGFESKRIYGKDSMSVLLPKLDGRAGIGVGFAGQRRFPMWKLAFGGGLYWSPLKYSALGMKGKAVVRGLDIDFSASYGMHPINQSGQLRPVVFVGLSLDYLDIERGATDSVGKISDVTLSGASVKIGGGIDLILSDLLVLNGRIIYRRYELQGVGFEDDWYSIVPYISAGGYNLVLGLTFTFQPKN